MRTILCICIFYLFVSEISGQFTDDYEDYPPRDTTSGIYDTSEVKNNTFFDLFTGRPGKAAFYSLIVPGGGQFYNKRYWKIPLVWGIEGGAIYWYLWNDKRLDDWQEGYLGLLNGDIESYRGITQANTAKLYRDRYRKNKEYAYIGIILGHLLNVFDAFIDRHLIDFDMDENISFYNSPEDKWLIPTFGQISIKIPLNKSSKPIPKNILASW